ncbi:peptidase S8/S53 domain-containing protein [Mortierella sp. GBAus27b]|nr:hypothetical protein BGX31_000290 [Mortierella sp. GBA43]KAI8350068.1 peptidase S8/S53 domain-containing protein [Mortierella sp. GBAus27b]
MKFLSLAVVACLALGSSTEAATFRANSDSSSVIPNSYIVVLKNDSSIHTFQPKFTNMVSRITNSRTRSTTKIDDTFTSFPGYVATLDAASLKNVLGMPEVESVEQEGIFKAVDFEANTSPNWNIQTYPPSWGLSRLSRTDAVAKKGKKIPPPPPYLYPKSEGAGITVYVVDTGIRFKHPDFEGRAKHGISTTSSVGDDENGHGTHVAATIAGKKYGAAKKAKLVSVKVLRKNGFGTTRQLLQGLEWIIKDAKGKRAVVNMSVAGPDSDAVDLATKALTKAGIPVIAAAGNEGNVNSACRTSPARAPHVIAVGNLDIYDGISPQSSLGKCVDMFAPGTDITSAWFTVSEKKVGKKTVTSVKYTQKTISGTSMASPHVAGVAALYMSENKKLKTAKQVYDKLKSSAHKNKVKGNLRKAANRIVFNGIAKK